MKFHQKPVIMWGVESSENRAGQRYLFRDTVRGRRSDAIRAFLNGEGEWKMFRTMDYRVVRVHVTVQP